MTRLALLKILICSILVVLFAALVWKCCNRTQEIVSLPSPVPAAQPVLTATYMVRDEKTGERLRIEKRDESGVLRELEILYLTGDTGVRHYSAAGRLMRVTLSQTTGMTFEGEPAVDGKSFNNFQVKNKAGVVVRRGEALGDNQPDMAEHRRYSIFRDDGTLLCVEEIGVRPYIFRVYHADGKTLHMETEIGQFRKWLKIYTPDAKLFYEEKVEVNAKYGDMIRYPGTIFDGAGKPSKKLVSTEGPYSNWHAHIVLVEVVNPDGSVVSSSTPEVESDRYQAPLRDPVLQGIVDAKARCYKVRNEEAIRNEVCENELERVLFDR